MSILNDLRSNVAAASAKAAAPAATERKSSDFWLNIGISIPGPANADGTPGEPIFVSLPVGLPLDDMKPQAIKGTNQAWIDLAQTKNALLEELQKAAATMAPGERNCVSALSVELYRKNVAAPEVGTAAGNPLMASLLGVLKAA